ncbi:MAG: hypothetical protein ACTILK_00315 [Bifidobacterium crudilactis]|uniref:hypothetical protein n=1 Tax=Bifidobacterium crudilactis TaxID=327277 RepID=UPI003F9C4D79
MNTRTRTRIAGAALAALLAFSGLALTSTANAVTATGDQNATVTYDIVESFDVTVPSGFTLTGDGPGAASALVGTSDNLKITKAVIAPDKALNVKLKTGDTDLEITNGSHDADIQLVEGANTYTKSNGQTLLTVAAGSNPTTDSPAKATVKAQFKDGIVPTDIKAGSYTGTVTFTVEVA